MKKKYFKYIIVLIMLLIINKCYFNLLKGYCGGKQYAFVNHLIIINHVILMFMLNMLQLIICLLLLMSHFGCSTLRSVLKQNVKLQVRHMSLLVENSQNP